MLSKNAEDLLQKRYVRNNENTWDDVVLRVANAIGKSSERIEEYKNILTNLDFLPIPAWYLIDFQKISRENAIEIETSRGCPHSCNFCYSKKMWGRMVRYKSLKRVSKEICLLKRHFTRLKNIYIVDDNLTANKERLKNLCEILRRKDIAWSCYGRIDEVDEKILNMMKNAGCKCITFGIESTSYAMTKLMKKEFKRFNKNYKEKLRKIFKICNKIGLLAGSEFMLNFPKSTTKNIIEDFKFARCIKGLFFFNDFVPLMNTKARKLANKMGQKVPSNLEEWIDFESNTLKWYKLNKEILLLIFLTNLIHKKRLYHFILKNNGFKSLIERLLIYEYKTLDFKKVLVLLVL